MIPIIIDPKTVSMALIGRGEVAGRRLALLDQAGAADLAVFSDAPEPGFAAAAGRRLRLGLPISDELEAVQILWIADLPLDLAKPIAVTARARGTIVNVEDVRPYCDFHNPAQVRRGDLLLTVSTNGKSPGLAVRIKRQLALMFGPEWAGRVDAIGRKRKAWRRRERPLPELAQLTNAAIDAKSWLPGQRPANLRLEA
ncbi:MAG: siroheme synthase [Alphaproteobacteria bacterium]|nr:siroheme synthase [Alphaproteobacteria bacterium]